MWGWLKQWWGSESAEVQFQFEEKHTQLLGITYRPMAEVAFWSPADNTWQRIRMLIDTGADYTLLPRFWARLLGIDLSQAQIENTTGIGGWEAVYFVPEVKVRIGKLERVIPVGFASSDRVPPLMGRHLFFETFETRFVGKKSVVFKNI